MADTEQNIYAERPIEELDHFYFLHVDHMQREGLTKPNAIAAELGVRDLNIARQQHAMDFQSKRIMQLEAKLKRFEFIETLLKVILYSLPQGMTVSLNALGRLKNYYVAIDHKQIDEFMNDKGTETQDSDIVLELEPLQADQVESRASL